jgi:GDPmannose 4,6-dehydratase
MRILKKTVKKVMLGRVEIRRDWGWATKYVEAMWGMQQQKEPNEYVVAIGKEQSLQDFVAETFR